MNNKRKQPILVISCVICGLLLGSCAAAVETPREESPAPSPMPVSIIAEGQILPAEERVLAFEVGGIVHQVFVEEGDWVQKGDVLAEIGDPAALNAQMTVLDSELLTVQQALDDLERYADVDRELSWQRVLDAQAAYNAAQQSFDEFDSDRYQDDLEKAAEAIIDARQAVDDAREELAEYQDLDAENATRKRYEDALERAEDTYNEKVRAKSELELEHDRIVSALNHAESALSAAQFEYEQREDGPDDDALAQLEAQVEGLKAQQANISAQLEKLTMIAPVDGEVVQILVEEEEFAAPGIAVVRLADTHQWAIETTDLTEMEVADLAVGQSVRAEAEAFPGEVFTGMIEQIMSYPQIKQGDVLYTVRITIDSEELPALRWGMTVTLTFE